MVEVTFRGQYVGRNDMARIANRLRRTCVYSGKEVVVTGVRVKVTELWLRNSMQVLACFFAVFVLIDQSLPLFFPLLAMTQPSARPTFTDRTGLQWLRG